MWVKFLLYADGPDASSGLKGQAGTSYHGPLTKAQ